MAGNVVAVQILQDGPSNTICKLTGTLDSSDEAYVVKLDPATLSSVTTDTVTRGNRLRIRLIDANIEDGLTVTLWWDVDGTSGNAKRIEDLHGRLVMDYKKIGGLVNNAVAPTGKIFLSTEGWQTGSILSYSIILECIKYTI